MRFYGPGPVGVVTPGMRDIRIPYASAGRVIYGADGTAAMGVTANSGELYEGEFGNIVVVTLWNISGARFVLNFWNSRTGVQIGTNLVTASGFADIFNVFKGNAVLYNLFSIRMANTTDRVMDPGMTMADGEAMTGGQG